MTSISKVTVFEFDEVDGVPLVSMEHTSGYKDCVYEL